MAQHYYSLLRDLTEVAYRLSCGVAMLTLCNYYTNRSFVFRDLLTKCQTKNRRIPTT